jgi:hypothetical protein
MSIEGVYIIPAELFSPVPQDLALPLVTKLFSHHFQNNQECKFP